MISVHLLSQAIIVAKITLGFQRQLLQTVGSESILQKEKNAILSQPEKHQDKVVAFVPDQLEFGWEEGVDIFKITVFPYQMLVVTRSGEKE